LSDPSEKEEWSWGVLLRQRDGLRPYQLRGAARHAPVDSEVLTVSMSPSRPHTLPTIAQVPLGIAE